MIVLAPSVQLTDTVCMVRPAAFGYNPETATNNAFQAQDDTNQNTIQAAALAEFDGMVAILNKNGITVKVLQDTVAPHTPDSIFPNNWISFHADSQVILYPMFAPNRRMERVKHWQAACTTAGLEAPKVVDFSYYENENKFLEGTGSLILDRVNKIAFANYSIRTDKDLLDVFAQTTGYQILPFTAIDRSGKDIYHTNVVMALGLGFVVICMDAIPNENDRKQLQDAFAQTNRKIVEISYDQLYAFAGNMLQLRATQGESLLVMSAQAYHSLTQAQIDTLSEYARLVATPLDTIEKYGGGSARCMLAEVFI